MMHSSCPIKNPSHNRSSWHQCNFLILWRKKSRFNGLSWPQAFSSKKQYIAYLPGLIQKEQFEISTSFMEISWNFPAHQTYSQNRRLWESRKETKAIRHFRRQWTIKKILKYISRGKKNLTRSCFEVKRQHLGPVLEMWRHKSET